MRDRSPIASLQDRLDAITARTRRLVQEDRLAVSERATGALFATGIESRTLPVGATAPAFALEDATSGRRVRSTDLLALGPLIVKFFRGRWCPYCITELEAWRDLLPRVRQLGALLVGISPADRSYFRSILVNIPFANSGLTYDTAPESAWRLPLPATFVLRPGAPGHDPGVVFAEAHADFRVRAEPAEVLDLLARQQH